MACRLRASGSGLQESKPEVGSPKPAALILVSFHLIVDSRRTAADGRARERTLLAAHQGPDSRGGAGRSSDQKRALLPGPPRLHLRRLDARARGTAHGWLC